MSIHRIGPEFIGPKRSKATSETQATEGPSQSDSAGEPSAGDRLDKVELSAEGRALVAAGSPNGPTPEGIEAVRAKIASGTYDSPEIAEIVAQRLIASGDLDS